MQSMTFSSRNKTVDVYDDPDIYLISINGLSPEGVINTSSINGYDGSTVVSSNIPERAIDMVLGFKCGDAEEAKERLYSIFAPEAPGVMVYSSALKTRKIDFISVKTEIDLAEYPMKAQISLICPDPYFHNISPTIKLMSDIVGLFHFPFKFPPKSYKNLLDNSGFLTDTTDWSLGTGWAIDPTTLNGGCASLKISRTGLSLNTDSYAVYDYNNAMPCRTGDIFSLSVMLKTDDYSAIDGNIRLGCDYLTSAKGFLAPYQPLIVKTLTVNNAWVKVSITIVVKNVNAAFIAPTLMIRKNGTLWMSCPKLEYTYTITDHAPQEAINSLAGTSVQFTTVDDEILEVTKIEGASTVTPATVDVDISPTNVATITNASNFDISTSRIDIIHIPYSMPKLPNGVQNTIEQYMHGKWKFIQRIGKIILNGGESGWVSEATAGTAYRFTLPVVNVKTVATSATNVSVLCDKLMPISPNESFTTTSKGGITGSTGSSCIQIRYPSCDNYTVTQFKAWLTANPITVYYELATPIETLISDLYMPAYAGLTILSSNANPQVNLTANITGTNLLKNSSLLTDNAYWNFKDGATTLDSSTNCNNCNSIKILETSLISAFFAGAYQYVDAKKGDTLTFSAWYYMTSKSTLDKEIALYLSEVDINNAKITGVESAILVSVANAIVGAWTKISVTRTITSDVCAKVKAYMCIIQNGTVWFSCPVLEREAISHDWEPKIIDNVPSTVFDFSPYTFKFSERMKSVIENFVNDSMVDVYPIIEFIARTNVDNPSIMNIETYQKAKINISMYANDRIVIDTRRGYKNITLTRNGVDTDIFNSMADDFRFIKLAVGDNYLKYDADTNPGGLTVTVAWDVNIGGI